MRSAGWLCLHQVCGPLQETHRVTRIPDEALWKQLWVRHAQILSFTLQWHTQTSLNKGSPPQINSLLYTALSSQPHSTFHSTPCCVNWKNNKRGYVFPFGCIFFTLNIFHLIIFLLRQIPVNHIVIFQTSHWFLSQSNRFLECLSGHICQLHPLMLWFLFLIVRSASAVIFRQWLCSTLHIWPLRLEHICISGQRQGEGQKENKISIDVH